MRIIVRLNEDDNSLYYQYKMLLVNTSIHEGKIPALEKALPFLGEFLDKLPKEPTLERITIESVANMSDPPKDFSEDDMTQTCVVEKHGDVVVHRYWSKDCLAGENSRPNYTLIVYVAPTSDALKIERVYSLRTKYPFLEQILKAETHPLFDIEEATLNESTLADKCYNHGSEGPENFDEEFYSVSRYIVRCLGLKVDRTGNLVDAFSGKIVDPNQLAPTVKERIASQQITADFLVKRRHLKYEIDGEHHHDVTLIVYRPSEYVKHEEEIAKKMSE